VTLLHHGFHLLPDVFVMFYNQCQIVVFFSYAVCIYLLYLRYFRLFLSVFFVCTFVIFVFCVFCEAADSLSGPWVFLS